MTKQERQNELNTLHAALHWLINGGNSYSFVGRERLSAQPIDVAEAITAVKHEIALVLAAQVDG